MRTRADMETELLARLLAADNSTLYPAARLTTLIKGAYLWATQEFNFSDLTRALKTSSISGDNYYDYPTEFKSNSIIRLTLDDEEYDRVNFEDFLDYQKKHSGDSSIKVFANYGRQYHIFPAITENGTNNICVWGNIQSDTLMNSTSTTIFTDNKEDGNEAIVKRALAVAVVRIDSALHKSETEEARALLSNLYEIENKMLQRDQRLEHPKFIVPDFYARGGRRTTNPAGVGNFRGF